MSGRMVSVPFYVALCNSANDMLDFCLEPETFPVFAAWMKEHGKVRPKWTDADMRRDMETIRARLQRHIS